MLRHHVFVYNALCNMKPDLPSSYSKLIHFVNELVENEKSIFSRLTHYVLSAPLSIIMKTI